MKYWLPILFSLMVAGSVRAEDYHVVSSPSLALDVFIDNVASSAPQSWCQETLALRIVSTKATDSSILGNFLPQVGNLLHNQCNALQELPWQMTSSKGAVLAVGTARLDNRWKPVITADATATATAENAAPLDISPPASTAPLSTFALPGGCHFRTWWDSSGESVFIPENTGSTCNNAGWLEGRSELSLANGQKQPLPLDVTFYQGYPLQGLHPTPGALNIVTINNQRLVVSRPDAPDSWLVLPFIPELHVWSFEGTLLVKMDKTSASNTDEIKARVTKLRQSWSAMVEPGTKVNVLLVDALHADLADPATGAWRTVN